MKAILEKDIGHLARLPEFKKKVIRAFQTQKSSCSYRVYWKPYGWIEFRLKMPEARVWIGRVEDWTKACAAIQKECERIERENQGMMQSTGMPQLTLPQRCLEC